MHKIAFYVSFTILALPQLFGQHAAQRIPKQAIICLTYDDGLETQLLNVLPQLDSIGLKATFFLNSIQGASQSSTIGQAPEAVLGWTNAAKNGHELGNHTLFHACPESIGWDKSISTDQYTIKQIIEEIRIQNAMLALLDPKPTKRSFAFPCNNVYVGNINYSNILRDSGLVTFARMGGDSNSIVSDFKNMNTMQIPSWHVWTGTTAQQLISFAERVKKVHGMGVYQFHGVGGQIFQISKDEHSQFLSYLKEHADEYLVVTFSEAVALILNQQMRSR